MAKLNLNSSENIRDNLTIEQQKQISDMYGQLAEKAQKQADNLKETPSSWDKRTALQGMRKQLIEAQQEMNDKINGTIQDNILDTAQAVVDDNSAWLTKAGMKIQGAYSNVPQDAVNAVISGKLYNKLPDGSNWTLSGALWQDSQKFQTDINSVIAQGIAANKSTFEIAKDLEMYVDPAAKKPWDWGKVYPGSRKVVDYNAQRLARTAVAHAYQLSLVTTTAKNPFITGYIWHVAHSHGRVCEICQELDEQFFEKNELPLDHPNGMCFWECAIPDSFDDIANRIGNWYSGKIDPELDTFAASLRGTGGTKQNATAIRKTGSVMDKD